MAPLKLYGMVGSTNTLRVAVALNELSLDYEFVSVPLTTGAHKKPEYLAINPFGHLPSLEDGDLKLFAIRGRTMQEINRIGGGLFACGSLVRLVSHVRERKGGLAACLSQEIP